MKKRSFLSVLSFVMSMVILLTSLSVLDIIPISAADESTSTNTMVAYDLSGITEVEDQAKNLLNGTHYEIRTSAVLKLGGIDLSEYAQIKITYGSDKSATFGGKFLAIVSDTTLPTSTTAANVLSYAAVENPPAGATSWTPDRSLILDLPADGDVYLAASISHGINIYSIQMIPHGYTGGGEDEGGNEDDAPVTNLFDATTDLPTVTDESASDYVSGYTCGTFTSYTAEQATAAGLPEGYTDNVWKLTAPSTQSADTSSTGIVLDFTSWNIKVEDIQSMTIRYYVDANCGAIRMAHDYSANSWIYITENNGGIQTAQWAEVTLSKNFDYFGSNADGTLGKVGFFFRKGTTFYVDSITFTMKENLFDATTDLPTVTDEFAYIYTGHDRHGYGTFDSFTADQATAAGVPEGYTGNVWKVTSLPSHGTNTETGIVLDFTSWGIKVEDIASMTIRYHMDADCRALRLANNEAWILNTSDIDTKQWAEYIVNSGFDSFANNDDGTLGKVALCFRYGTTFYVDSITIATKNQVPALSVPGIFNSNMVLQRDMPIEIWGTSDAEEGSTITGTFGTDSATAEVASDGTWKLTFAAQSANAVGQTMTISDERGNQIVLDDILIGDVWFVAGQSNAELTVSSCLGYLNEGELDIDETDAIRLFAQRQAYVIGDEAFWSDPQSDVINPNWRWKRTNQAAVEGFSAIGYFFAKEVYEKTDVPQGVVMIAAGGARLSELFPEEMAAAQGYTEGGRVGIGGYYNALVHPFVGMNCKGMLFFQGESESGTRKLAERYAEEMTLLIEEWRELWEQEFPLYYVQLSEYPGTGVSYWNYLDILRASQFNALSILPNSTMVVSMDHGAPVDYSDWAHSPYKYPIGLRLAYAALAKEYGQGQPEYVISPMPIETTLSDDYTKITVKFKNVADGLIVRGMTPETSIGQQVAGFSVGSYQNRVAATATIISRDTIEVVVPQGVSPTHVNYAYFVTISADNANLYASSNLPAPSFSLPVPGAPEEDPEKPEEQPGVLFEGTTDLPTINTESASDYANGSYTYGSFDAYTAEQAAAAGLPAGYSDNVWKLTGANETGVVLDFTSWGIKVEDIQSMTIRYHVDDACAAIRVANNKQWILNTDRITKGEWAELTLSNGFDSFVNNDDGTLGKVALCFRYGTTFYVDSITFTLKGEDVEKPEYVGREEIPYETDDRSTVYGYKDLAIYTAEEAQAAGVPAGYTGYVMMLGGNAEVGIGMDLTDWNIPLALVESMTLRVYVPESILGGEVRIRDLAENWILRYVPTKAETNTWINITLKADGTGFKSGGFTSFLNEDQTLGEFDFGFRYPNGTNGTVAYVDSISFELKENDGKAPEIQYKGSTTITTSADKPFVLEDLVAYDEQEQRLVAPVLTWSEGALDSNGLLQKGTHTCVATFTDAYGNKSEITLTLNVGDKDTEAPVIKFGLTTIHATAGTRSDLEKTIVVTDNYDTIKPVITWSEGAVDAGNRLQVGTHTLTITATDLTGLQSQKTVTVIVTNTADAPVTPTPVSN